MAALELFATNQSLLLSHPLPTLEQRHLWWKVEANKHFNLFRLFIAACSTKANVLSATINTGTYKPLVVQYH
ncbi:MAG TPA: hypothetical protein QF700_02155 [Prochlorococcus sp.]|nr:hypothetical protein [Prochlorococcus sp.]